MDDAERYKLIAGPYAAPPLRRGDRVVCEALDAQVTVGGMSAGPIPWPTRARQGKYPIIVCGGLADAVRAESEIAVAHWWGVSIGTAQKWRRALGVGRVNAGTARLYADYLPEKDPAASSDHSAAGRLGGAARGEQVKRDGVPASTREALLAAARRPRSAEHRAAISAAHRAAHAAGRTPPNPRTWSESEAAELGTAPDRVVAARVGRTVGGVRGERQRRGVPAYTPPQES